MRTQRRLCLLESCERAEHSRAKINRRESNRKDDRKNASLLGMGELGHTVPDLTGWGQWAVLVKERRNRASSQRPAEWIPEHYHFWTALRANLRFVATISSETRKPGQIFILFSASWPQGCNAPASASSVLRLEGHRCTWLSLHL